MKAKFAPSINILRDQSLDFEYIVTPNADRTANEIEGLIEKGFRNFSIIGSYGSGKSSFLWALEKDYKGESNYFGNSHNNANSKFTKLIGEYASLREVLAAHFDTSIKASNIFDKLKFKEPQIIIIDEFGKFIEFAVRNEPEIEIYFLQQLAEHIADSENNCILITTLHQSFDAYSSTLLTASERNEWRKVKGRFKDLTFNEPVDQLLYLAAKKIDGKVSNTKIPNQNLKLQEEFSIVRSDQRFLKEIGSQLWPLDIFSAYILAVGLQRYGQNERSLFTFLEGEFDSSGTNQVTIADVYDYLQHEFFSFLKSDKNFDLNGWQSILNGLERTETIFQGNVDLAQVIIKTIGLVTLLGHKGAHLKKEFFLQYLNGFSKKEIEATLKELEVKKIILFTKYNNSYRITSGTDVDFAEALKEADREIDDHIDISAKVKEHFEFAVINAKSVTYRLGTPRFFEYVVSEKPIQVTPEGQIDGFINLVFNESIDSNKLESISKDQEETIYAYFNNVHDIKELLIDIERTSRALSRNHADIEARKEFNNILNSQKLLLNKSVIQSLFTEKVMWVYKGKRIKIHSSKHLNQKVSEICELVYNKTPVFKNELVNRHILVGAVGAKKPFFKALSVDFHKSDLGFPEGKFPAEKTVYLTLLKNTGIHGLLDSGIGFKQPNQSFKQLWDSCELFMESSKNEKKKISLLYEILSKKPFKLTQGFLEFWIPSYLFIRRDDFALFSKEQGYLPDITESHLHAFTRTPEDFEIKAFDVEGVKLDLYNKYRELLQLKGEERINNRNFIESVKPFMVFYHHLGEYAKTTSMLSKETRNIRSAIKQAEDPEKLFFEELPKSIHTDINELLSNDNQFDNYIKKIRESIRELQSCYDGLLDRVEKFIVEEILGQKDMNFADYKKLIDNRFAILKEHMLIPTQTALLIRLRSTLDRNSWIDSICHVLMGKKLELIKDKEEAIFKEKLRSSFQELDNMIDLSKSSNSATNQLIKVDISTLSGGTKEQVINAPSEIDDTTLDIMNNVEKALGKNKNLNKFILVNLLKKQFDE